MMLQNAQRRGGTAASNRGSNDGTNPAGTSRSFSLGRPSAFKPQPSPHLTERKPTAQDLSSIRDQWSSSVSPISPTHLNHISTNSVDHKLAGQDRLSSLFQKARARAPYGQSHSEEPASKQDGQNDASKSPTSSQDEKATIRQAHLQRLRERAEDARLELMAFELLESESSFLDQHSSLPMPREQQCTQQPRIAANQQKSNLDSSNSAPLARKSLQLSSTRPELPPRGSQLAPARAQTRSFAGRPQTLTLNKNAPGRAIRASKPLLTKQPRVNGPWMSGDYKFASSAEQSPTSPTYSPSPPVSPIAAANLAAEIYRATCGKVSATSFLKAEPKVPRRYSKGWKPTAATNRFPAPVEHSDIDEDDSDLFLQNHLDNCQEDLRDITLSGMLDRQLGLSSDDSDGPYNSGSESPSEEVEVPATADMTFADQTGIFMLAHQGVPSLLAETIPDADLADMTFMTCPDDSVDMKERAPRPYQEAQSSPQLSPMVMPKGSILDEFLKSLPPLPQSPVDQRWPSQRAHLRSGQSPIPNGRFARSPPLSPHGPERPMPTPIITSQERCQRILQGLSNRVDRFHSILTSTPVSRSVSSSPEGRSTRYSSDVVSATPTQRLLISIPTLDTHPFQQADSEASTPASAYNSAREDFTFGSTSDLTGMVPGEITENRQRSTRMVKADGSRQNRYLSSSSSTRESSAVSSPWTALSPASSTASNSSAGSSWTVGSM